MSMSRCRTIRRNPESKSARKKKKKMLDQNQKSPNTGYAFTTIERVVAKNVEDLNSVSVDL